MAVKFVKLISGEDFVADVDTDNVSKKGMLKVTKPIRFLLSPEGAVAIPYLPFCKNETHEIDSKNVLLMDEVELEVHNAYQEKFGSGILLSSSGMLKLTD